MRSTNNPNEIRVTRTYDAPVALVWEAWTDLKHVDKWWGPRGFTITTHHKDLRAGGTWEYTMHGPDGSSYPNESVFAAIERDRKVVIDHICQPFFRLTVELLPTATGTQLTWVQAFADPAVAEAVRHIVEPANEQNLDRLAAEVAGTGS